MSSPTRPTTTSPEFNPSRFSCPHAAQLTFIGRGWYGPGPGISNESQPGGSRRKFGCQAAGVAGRPDGEEQSIGGTQLVVVGGLITDGESKFSQAFVEMRFVGLQAERCAQGEGLAQLGAGRLLLPVGRVGQE